MSVPQRIVIGANAHAELTALLRAARPDLDIRGNRYTELTADDLAWGDSYVGFRRPPLPSMGNITWVHCTGAGVDSWLYPDELPREILLTRTSESFGPRIAEWALARALAFSQQIVSLHTAQQLHQWSPRETAMLHGSRVLVVGTGDIGTQVARLFGALGCHVTGVSRSGRGHDAVFAQLAATGALSALVTEAEWIVLTVPLTAASRGLFSRALLARCNGAVLINAGRGAVVEESALPDALAHGWLRGAALDVFDVEPLPATSPLWDDARVMISPHISGLTTNEGAVVGFLECLAAIERGETPAWVVDRERGY
ncbi:MAG: D-2-hydroxyacid dehydrogenase [Gemmatimonadaceae bacterium]|nr:D-2-hydroxyacid dehydrogenase [Gemmatimonadaceae bacterium]